MEKELTDIYNSLQEQVGLYRKLLELVRAEKLALLDADLKIIQESTNSKEVLLHSISQSEKKRVQMTHVLAFEIKKPVSELTLNTIILLAQQNHVEKSDQLRSVNNTLSILISRIVEQNRENQGLIDGLVGHLREMKKNVLGEGMENSSVYSQQKQKVSQHSGGRLLSQEV